MTQGTARRDPNRERYAAALMSIATVATAWCAYQSAEWGSEQAFLLGAIAMLTYPVHLG